MTQGRTGAPAARVTLGLTGNIATGKSAVMRMLSERGACGIDADAVYHELIAPHAPLWRPLVDEFGPRIVTDRGEIDRKRLGEIVFGDEAALARLDAITHPAVVHEIETRRRGLTCRVVVIDAVKLFESGLAARCDAVWLVVATPEQQISRLMRRNGLSRDQAAARVAAQPDESERKQLASEIIDNSVGLAETEEQVDAAWRRLLTRFQRGA